MAKSARTSIPPQLSPALSLALSATPNSKGYEHILCTTALQVIPQGNEGFGSIDQLSVVFYSYATKTGFGSASSPYSPIPAIRALKRYRNFSPSLEILNTLFVHL
jgi:hypothetical protein